MCIHVLCLSTSPFPTTTTSSSSSAYNFGSNKFPLFTPNISFSSLCLHITFCILLPSPFHLHLPLSSSLQVIMRPPSSLKEELLKQWVKRLQVWSSSSREMSLMDRTKAIKLSAGLAMASAKNGATSWSRALMANTSKDAASSPFLVPNPITNSYQKEAIGMTILLIKRTTRKPLHVRRKKIIAARHGRRNKRFQRCRKCRAASEIAKRLVEKRMRVLRGLVPGGEHMDESDLFKETLDYMLSLRAQVNVMGTLVNATQLLRQRRRT